MFIDALLAIVFFGIVTAALVCNADKIEDWSDSVKDQNLSWRE